jgi:hypothetical protein
MRKANREVIGPLHVAMMRAMAEANVRYGDPDLHLDGGTALSAYFLAHRESEDLDFFGGKNLNAKALGEILEETARAAGIEVLSLDAPTIGFARYLARGGGFDSEVKIDIGASSPFRLEPLEPTEEGIQVASYRDLCAGKLHAACDRYERRDFVDVHAIVRVTKSGLDANDEHARQRFRALVMDLMAVDPGLDPRIIGQGLRRAIDRPLVVDLPLRLLLPIQDDEIHATLRLCVQECASMTNHSL